MNKMIMALMIGAAAIATPVMAQEGGSGFPQRDQTRAEVQQRAQMLFQMIDANHDGVLTRQEAEQAAAQFAARGGRAGGVQRMIERAFGDAQSITLQQFEAQMLQRFDAMDLNHDGVVTAAEREQFRAQRAAAAGARAHIQSSPGNASDPSTSATTPPRA